MALANTIGWTNIQSWLSGLLTNLTVAMQKLESWDSEGVLWYPEANTGKNSLMNSPLQHYNCNETFLPPDSTRQKAVTLKNTKYICARAQGTTDHITVFCAVSAAVFPLPPFITYLKCFLDDSYRFDGPDDALYRKSKSRWIPFMAWLKKHFWSTL